jgi:DNA (cytosine-5)-methyltransferase 3A
MKKGEILLSPFGGYGGFRLSVENAGFKVIKEYYSEICPNASNVMEYHFPDAIHVGDVSKLKSKDFLDVTNLGGGSPCQNFSMMGKRQGLKSKKIEVVKYEQYLELKEDGFEFEGQSWLVWEYIRLQKEISKLQKKNGLPVLNFMLENVKMIPKWRDVISDALETDPIMINSSLLTAQNRERYYWTDYGYIQYPEDLKIFIGDVINGAKSGAAYRGIINKDGTEYSYPVKIRKDKKSNTLVTKFGNINKTNGKRFGTGFYEDKKGNIKLLTPEQGEILQGLSKGYTNVEGISQTAREKMIGNGWSIPTTTYILKQLKKNKNARKGIKN